MQDILNVNAESFPLIAQRLFLHHHACNSLYRQYCDALRVDPARVQTLEHIPYLPISFFKTHRVVASTPAYPMDASDSLVFESSGTTAGQVVSRHYVADAALYRASLLLGFRQYYGDPSGYAILALLPSYLERQNASLVYMAEALMQASGHPDNGFYLHEWDLLQHKIELLEQQGQKTLLLGVTFALLDFAAAHPMALRHTLVMETGGMKGRKQELTRGEVHQLLQQQWQLPAVHAEYGMTELLSQAYSAGGGTFASSATMRVLVRDINDPLDTTTTGTGALNIIDLANAHSCPFIATEDLGTVAADGTFTVLGRMDHSALRGCSLLAI